MEWPLLLLIIVGSLLVFMATGAPVFIAFIMINIAGVFLLFGGESGLMQLAHSMRSSVNHFSFLPVILFILMGEVMFHSGIIGHIVETVDKLLGRLPGRLSLVSVGAGVILATLTGSDLSGVAMLGKSLVPEMEKRGYKKAMTLGPILGSGGLAIMIPPSGLAVLLGSIAQIGVGKLLMAIIVPGLLMAVLYATYIITRCWLQPSIAPSYEVAAVSLLDKILSIVKYIFPVGIIIFLVIGIIFLGVATPTEAAASGAFGCFVLAFAYGGLNWERVKTSILGTVEIAGMVFIIIAGVKTFSQILAASGATQGFVELALGFPVAPIFILIIMQIILVMLGTFMEVVSIMMITIPLYMPVVYALNFDPIWFGALFVLNICVATISPPFGLSLFVMKGVAPADTDITDIYKAALPFLGFDLIVLALMIAFPQLALWLPGVMHLRAG